MWWRPAVSREAVVCAALAATVGGLLAWLGPPGTDFAAHAYQRTLFLRHGFTLWDDFWYAGRYSFVDYSVLYYPLAVLLGIRVLAVGTVAVAAFGFAVVAGREWGAVARWSSRSFAVVLGGFLISAAFPFALGIALALLALWALQSGHRWRFAVLTLLTLAASPVALVLLAVVLTGVAVARRDTLAGGGGAGARTCRHRRDRARSVAALSRNRPLSVLHLRRRGWRLASASSASLARGRSRARASCGTSSLRTPSRSQPPTWCRRASGRTSRGFATSRCRWRCSSSRSAVGDRCRSCFRCSALALAWNVTPLAAGLAHTESDVTAHSVVWRAPLAYLHAHLRPGYRVEAVDTAEHWPAFYLAESGIPLVRGWFRQDDFPFDALLYRQLTPVAYQRWLRKLGVAYVVLTRSPPDYSSRGEAALVRSGRAGLHRVWASREVAIYDVPRPRPIVTGPGRPTVLALHESRLVVRVTRGGTYRIAVHWSPYWHASTGCLARTTGGMLQLSTRAPTTVRIAFDVDPSGLLDALAGAAPTCPSAGQVEHYQQ